MGKQDYINIGKRVLHNLTINSTLPNTKNYFSVIRWVYRIINGAKRSELPTMRLGYRLRVPTYTQLSSPPYELFLCFVCILEI